MHNLYIVGAGGYGRVVLSQLSSDAEHNIHWRIAGFLDQRNRILDGYDVSVAVVGDPFTFQPQENDRFICALGSPANRKRYAAEISAKGGVFMNVLTEVYAGKNLKLGQGVFFERNTRIGPDCTIGNLVQIHSLSILGHDVKVGDYSQISCFSFIGGGVEIGREVTIYPHVCVLPGLKIGDGAVLGAGSVVVRDVPPGVTMFGNPAKRLTGP